MSPDAAPNAHTEVNDPTGEASAPPLGLVVVTWIGAFSVILWGMLLLWRRR